MRQPLDKVKVLNKIHMYEPCWRISVWNFMRCRTDTSKGTKVQDPSYMHGSAG